jgi:hypothetical protein
MGNATLRFWGTQNGLDGDTPFTAKVRARKAFGPGKTAEVFPPILYYRNPQGEADGTLSCTVQYIKNYSETMPPQTFVMEATQANNGISVARKKLESLSFAEAEVLDVVVSMTYTGEAYDSVTTPTIDALVVPYKEQTRA